jgi:hypothetical protein
MHKRTLKIVVAVLVAVAVVWTFCIPRKATDDKARYRQWHFPSLRDESVEILGRHLPTKVSEVLQFPSLHKKYWAREEELRDALLASGYLTRVHITMTNASGSSRQICDRLWKATRKSGAKWEISCPNNTEVVLTCRPQDVAVCKRIIAND